MIGSVRVTARLRPAAPSPTWPQWFLLASAATLVVYLVSGPLAVLILTAFRRTRDALPFEPQAAWSLDNFTRLAADPVLYATVAPQTAVYVGGAVTIAMGLSTLFAWLIERTDIPARHLLFVLIVSPLIIPTVVKAIAWVYLLGPAAGYLNLAARSLFGLEGPGPLNIYSMPGLVLVQGIELVPLGVIFLTAAFQRLDPQLEEASAVCGGRPLTTFRRVTLPVLLPATLALLIVITTLTLEMVEVPLAIGTPGGVTVFSTWMFFAMNPAGVLPDYGRVAAAVMPVLVIGAVFLLLYNRATRIAERYATVTGRGYRPRRIGLGRWRWMAAIGALAYFTVALVLPAFIMLAMSLVPGTATASTGVPDTVSFDAYARVFADPATLLAFRNTLVAGSIGATTAVLLATLVAWVVVRTHLPGRGVLDALAFAPLTIPAVIMGFAIGLLYLVLPVPIYGTVWILAVAYATRMAIASRIMRASLIQIHRELEDASTVSGATWLTTFYRIVVPLLAPGLLVSWLLLFVVSFREFTIGMILSRPDNIVVGVHLWRLYERGLFPEASALGFTMILVVVATMLLARRLVLSSLGSS